MQALDKYIDIYKSESHPYITLDEQQRTYDELLQVQEKIRQILRK
jgi:hypothetical protein